MPCAAQANTPCVLHTRRVYSGIQRCMQEMTLAIGIPDRACVDDNVGVFTRAVLPYYMSTNWLESCPSEKARSSCIECRLGCTMRMANVSVATLGLGGDGFRRSILREDETHEVELPARALEGFPMGSYDQTNGSLIRLDSESGRAPASKKQVYWDWRRG